MAHDTAHHMAHSPDSVREFFTERAARWDDRFPDDGPAFAAAVAEIGLRPGDSVLDAGCGTGRALSALREAVGDHGTVLGFDLTPAMIETAVRSGRHHTGQLAVADVSQLPLRDACLDAVFAAGLISHLPGAEAGLGELARVVRPGGVLALFHPVGRVALAARQGRRPAPDDLRAEANLRSVLPRTGWHLTSCSDEPERYLALAVRAG